MESWALGLEFLKDQLIVILYMYILIYVSYNSHNNIISFLLFYFIPLYVLYTCLIILILIPLPTLYKYASTFT